MTPANTPWARGIVAALARGGLTHLALAPGSRSTPLVLAARDAPEVTLHVTVDERAAAFHALGAARAAGDPAGVLTTSGTATGNLHPAIQEAAAASTPLVALTADRPPEKQGVGARQTLDQTRLYPEARLAVTAGPPTGDDADHAASLAARAVAAARGPRPGPVHLNLRLRKPLTPDPGDRAPPDVASAPRVAPTRLHPEPADVRRLGTLLDEASRPVLLAGPHPRGEAWADALAALALRAGAPLLTDVQSGLRRHPAPGDERVAFADGFLTDPTLRTRLAPDVLVQVGRRPTGKRLQRFLTEAERHVVVTPDADHPDPRTTADLVLRSHPGQVLPDLHPSAADPDWMAAWRRADEAARHVLHRDRKDPWEATAAAGAAEATPDGGLVWTANSLPVRHLERCLPPADDGVHVLSHLGASGIDGTVSAGLGAACTGRPTTILLGDVAAVHDLAALDLLRRCDPEARVVVLDNDGGEIFSLLPIEDHEDVRDDAFRTPSPLDLPALLEAAGLEVERTTPDETPTAPVAVVDADPGAADRFQVLGHRMGAAARDILDE